MNVWRPVTSMISSRMDSFSGLRPAPATRAAVASGSRYIRTLARPRAIVCSPSVGIDVGQRAVRVVAGQVPVPQLLEERDRGLPADLLAAHLPGELGRVGVGVAEHEGRGGQDQQLVGRSGRSGPAGP